MNEKIIIGTYEIPVKTAYRTAVIGLLGAIVALLAGILYWLVG